MNALIIEDELPAVRRLTHLLAEVDPQIKVVHSVGTTHGAINWLQENKNIDLIFSDIHLTDGLSFLIYQQVDPPCPIIFTTAYDEYAIQAFKLNSLDYLLKPIVSNELKAALIKFRKLTATVGSLTSKSNALPFDVEPFMAAMANRQPIYRQRFLINHRETYTSVSTNEIAYFYSENKITRLVQPNGRWFPVPDTLDKLVDQLDPALFFQINRQFIIQSTSLITIHKHFNGKLKLDLLPAPSAEVMVSRERAEEFKKWLNN